MNCQSHILLVEDDQLDVLTFQRALSELEIRNPLLIASTGEEALSLLAEQQNVLPQIILLDLNMPRMNGIELLAALKKHPVWRRIPVIVLTTSDQEHERRACFELSAAGYIVKPLDYQAFVKIVSVICAYWCINRLAD
jgi:CheY-like chemotaxis protein